MAAAGKIKDKNIHIAAMDGDEATIQRWLDAGLFVDKRDNLERTALHQAAWSGRIAVVRMLLGAYAVVDARDKDQCTPLHYAAQTNQAEVVSELLRFKANMDAKDIKQETPIFKACMLGHVQTIECLLAAGANPDLRDIEGKAAGEEVNLKVTPEVKEAIKVLLNQWREEKLASQQNLSRIPQSAPKRKQSCCCIS